MRTFRATRAPRRDLDTVHILTRSGIYTLTGDDRPSDPTLAFPEPTKDETTLATVAYLFHQYGPGGPPVHQAWTAAMARSTVAGSAPGVLPPAGKPCGAWPRPGGERQG